MIDILCRLRGHKPRYIPGERYDKDSFGPGFRMCDRCGVVLEGHSPQLGDRMKASFLD